MAIEITKATADIVPSRERTITPISNLIVEDVGRLVLLEKEQDGQRYHSLPSGHVEDGETFRQAMVREANEELGIEIDEDDLAFAHASHTDDRVILTFRALRWRGTPYNREPHKHLSMDWFLKTDLPLNTRSYIKEILQNISRGVHSRDFRL